MEWNRLKVPDTYTTFCRIYKPFQVLTHKVGVLYVKDGQQTAYEAYFNSEDQTCPQFSVLMDALTCKTPLGFTEPFIFHVGPFIDTEVIDDPYVLHYLTLSILSLICFTGW